MHNLKEVKRFHRHQRVRNQLTGTSERPRLCVHRSLNNLQAQLIDDTQRKILFGLSTLDKGLRSKLKSGGNLEAATALGEALAKMALSKGISQVAFDRGGYMFHGRIKAFAEAARGAGLKF
jgi:large subunit ribosomal protein L18